MLPAPQGGCWGCCSCCSLSNRAQGSLFQPGITRIPGATAESRWPFSPCGPPSVGETLKPQCSPPSPGVCDPWVSSGSGFAPLASPRSVCGPIPKEFGARRTLGEALGAPGDEGVIAGAVCETLHPYPSSSSGILCFSFPSICPASLQVRNLLGKPSEIPFLTPKKAASQQG